MFVNNFLAPIQVRLSPNFVSYTIGYRGRGDLNFGRSRSLEQVCALLNDLLVNSALRCDCRQQRRFLITAFHHSRNSQWRWHFTNLNQKWRAINKQPAESGKRVAGNYVDIQLSVCATVRHWSATPANSLNASTHLITITSVQTGTHWLTVSELRLHDVKDKSKGFPYSLPSVGPGTDPGVQTGSPQVTISHPPGGRLHYYFPPSLRLPSRPESITAPWPVPSYPACCQRHIGVNNLPKVGCFVTRCATAPPTQRTHRLYQRVPAFLTFQKSIHRLAHCSCTIC